MLLVSARPSKRLQETAERAVCSVRGGRRWQAPAGAGAQVSEVRHAHRIASTCRALPSGALASVSSPCPAVGPGLGVTQTVQQPVRPVVTQHLPAGAACRGAQEAAPGGLCFTACVRGWECHGAGGRHACPGARGEGPEASCCVARGPALSARRRQHAGAPRGVGGRAGGLSGGGPGGGRTRTSSRWRWGADVFVFLCFAWVWGMQLFTLEARIRVRGPLGAWGWGTALLASRGRGRGSAGPQPVWDRVDQVTQPPVSPATWGARLALQGPRDPGRGVREVTQPVFTKLLRQEPDAGAPGVGTQTDAHLVGARREARGNGPVWGGGCRGHRCSAWGAARRAGP